MNSFFLGIRALHVLLGAVWLGTAVFASFFLLPSVQQAGPEGGKVMVGLLRRRLDLFIHSIAGLTVLSGLWLYWRYTDGFDPVLSGSMGARVFGAGGVLGLVAAIIASSIVVKNMKRAVRLMTEAAGQADAAQRSALVDRAGQLRRKAGAGGRIVAVLLIVTIMLMAVGHYV